MAQGASAATSTIPNGGVTGPKISSTAEVKSNGSSTSGTAGTVIASLTQTNGRLIGIHITGDQSAAANTQMTLTVTYSDTTTGTLTTTANQVQLFWGGGGGALYWGASNSGQLQFSSSLGITAISMATAGTGTGTRRCSMSALDVTA